MNTNRFTILQTPHGLQLEPREPRLPEINKASIVFHHHSGTLTFILFPAPPFKDGVEIRVYANGMKVSESILGVYNAHRYIEDHIRAIPLHPPRVVAK